jgi:non-specific serine/threonine protein kinase
LLAGGATGSALSLVEDFAFDDERPVTMGQRQVRLAAAELALHQSDATRTLRLLESLRGDTTTAPAVDLRRARAMRALGRLDEAAATLATATDLARACDLSSLTWRLQADYAAVLDQLGRTAQAGEARAEATAIVVALADELTDTGLGEGFLAAARRVHGIEAPKRRPPRPRRGPGGLTARELEIARLIAQGDTNRAMAESLVLSERTVEDHVGRILKKLGFSSRAQIAAWAARQAGPQG